MCEDHISDILQRYHGCQSEAEQQTHEYIRDSKHFLEQISLHFLILILLDIVLVDHFVILVSDVHD